MRKINIRFLAHYFTVTLVVTSLWFLSLPSSAQENRLGSNGLTQKPFNPKQAVNLLLTAENEPWLLSIVTPAAARLGKINKNQPLLTVIPTNYPAREVALTSKIATTHTLLLATAQHMAHLPPQAIDLAGQTISLPNQKTQASLQIAKQFWSSSRKVIGAWAEDTESVIIGATLAAHEGVPFLLFSNELRHHEWQQQLNALKVRQITLIKKRGTANGSWLDRDYQVSRFEPVQITSKLVQHLGHSLKNILLARTPRLSSDIGANTWLVPYISWQRKSLPLLLTTDDPTEIENQTTRLIQKYALKPSTLTLLGDKSALGQYDYQIESAYAEGDSYNYELPVEIFTYPQDEKHALSVGVGRIPFNPLYQTASLFVRGLYREQQNHTRPHHILMIANPLDEDEDMGLPLCETISKATSRELRNFSLNVDEFYRRLPDDPKMMEASQNADLIIFQGHAYHQRLVEDPEFQFQFEMDDVQNPEIHITHQDTVSAPTEYEGVDYKGWATSEELPQQGWAQPEEQLFQSNPLPFKPHHFVDDQMPAVTGAAMSEPQLNPIQKRFHSLPIVILQSCNSLEYQMPDWLLQLGGVALIGSVSNIHSASGSSFIKALLDHALYQGETLGTALRDARNYFYVLQDLKNQRGHREQAKSLRVALSFRLWGDPQLKVFKPLPTPKKPALSVVWNTPHTLTIATPSKRLAKIETEKYIAHGYPGVQYAGLIKSLKNKQAKKVIPLYFVKTPLPIPQVEQYQSLTVLKGEADRVAYRIDPKSGQLYLIYLTHKENKYPVLRFKFASHN